MVVVGWVCGVVGVGGDTTRVARTCIEWWAGSCRAGGGGADAVQVRVRLPKQARHLPVGHNGAQCSAAAAMVQG